MKVALFYVVFGLCFQLTSASGSSREEAVLNLITNVLMKNYSKQVLPMVNFNKPVKVTIQLIARRLVEVNEKKQYVTIYSGVMIKWNNPMLSWIPKQHMGVEFIHLRHGHVWVPDICLYNTIDDSGNMAAKIDTPVKVHFSGNSTWLSPYQFKAECKIDVNFFPFDHQVCNLEFGSWTYDGHHIDIDPLSAELNFSQLVESPAWHIADVMVVKKIKHYPEPYPSVTYRFVMERRILYYLTNLIIPCVVISFMAFLSFCIPVQSGERIALVITMLLSMTVYMILIFNFMPATSEVVPLVGKFYLACIIEIALCLVATFLTIKWYHNETPMPKWIQCLVNKYLATVLRFKQLKSTRLRGFFDCKRKYSGGHGTLKENDLLSDDGIELTNMADTMFTEENPTFIANAKRSLATMSDKIRQDEEVNGFRLKWKYASKVVDRFFFLLFLLLFVITVVLIFYNLADSKEEALKKSLLI